MTVIGFNIINPVIHNRKPFYDNKKNIFYIPVKNKYRYYVECSDRDEQGNIAYYVLLSNKHFDENCIKCHTDNYFRCQLKLHKDLLEYVKEETSERGNIICEYLYSVVLNEEENIKYDVFKIE